MFSLSPVTRARAIGLGHMPCAAIAIGRTAARPVPYRPRAPPPGKTGVRVPAGACRITISLWLSSNSSNSSTRPRSSCSSSRCPVVSSFLKVIPGTSVSHSHSHSKPLGKLPGTKSDCLINGFLSKVVGKVFVRSKVLGICISGSLVRIHLDPSAFLGIDSKH